MKGGKLLDGEGFGAGLGRNAGGFECLADSVAGEAGGAEIVGEGLALLGETVLEEGDEGCLFDAERSKAGGEVPAEDGGVDLGRRVEGFRGQRKEGFGGAVELEGDGEEAVLACARAGGDTVGYFALDHEDGMREGWSARGEAQQDGRSDVVRQVADDDQRLANLLREGSEVVLEHVLTSDGDCGEAFFGEESLLDAPGEFAVEFDGDEALGLGGDALGDDAFAGADFDDGAGGDVSQGGDDALDGSGVAEEVLPEFGFCGHGGPL